MNFFQKSTKQETGVDFFVNPQAEKTKFSSKYLYFIFGVLVLVLLLEGGYLFYLHQKKKELSARNNHLQNVSWVRVVADEEHRFKVIESLTDSLKRGELASNSLFLNGEVKKIDGSVVKLLAEPQDQSPLIFFDLVIAPTVKLFYTDVGKYNLPQNWEKIEDKKFDEVVKVGKDIIVGEIIPYEGEILMVNTIYVER